MNALAGGLLVSVACSTTLLGQERDRSLDRISLELQQPAPVLRGLEVPEPRRTTRLGVFTLVPPTARGEIVRVALPIGELVARAFRSVAAANRGREAAAARRQVAADLAWFNEQQSRRKR